MNDRRAIEELLRASSPGAPHSVLHYVYFPAKRSASLAAEALRRHGFEVEERLGADGVNWLALARHRIVPSEESIGAARETVERVAAEHGGEYDGWEAEVVRTGEQT